MRLEHPVPEEYLKLIGDITVSFSMLENTLNMLVHLLIGVEQRIGFTITSEMSFRQIRTLAKNLFALRCKNNFNETDINQFEATLKRISDIEIKRNQITHSFWGVGLEADSVTRIKIQAKEKKGLHFLSSQVTKEELQRIGIEIKSLAFEIQDIHYNLVKTGKPYP